MKPSWGMGTSAAVLVALLLHPTGASLVCMVTETTYASQSCSGSPTVNTTYETATGYGSPCYSDGAHSYANMYCDSGGYHLMYYAGTTNCSGTPLAMNYEPNTCLYGSIFECGSGCPAFTGTPSPTPAPMPARQPPATCNATQSSYTDLISCSGSPSTTSTHQVWTSPGSPCYAQGAYSIKDIYCDAAGYHQTIYSGSKDCSGTPRTTTFLPTTCDYGIEFACGGGCPALGPTPVPTPAPPRCMATWRRHTDTTNCTDAGTTESMIVHLAPGSPCVPVAGTGDSVKDQYCDANGYHHKYYLGDSACRGSPIVETYTSSTCLHGHGFVCGSGCPARNRVSSGSKQNSAWMIAPLVAASVWGRAALILA